MKLSSGLSTMASAEVLLRKEYWGTVKGQNEADKQRNPGQATSRNGMKQEN